MKSLVAAQMLRQTQVNNLRQVMYKYGVFVETQIKDADGNVVGTREDVGDGWQMLTEPIRDYQTYPAAGYLSRGYFQAAEGAAGTTAARQNMPDSGKMPRGQIFFWEGIECDFVPAGLPATIETAAAGVGAFANDMWKIYHGNGHLAFTINSRPYLNVGPLAQFPPSFRINGAFAVASETTAASVTPLATFQTPFCQGEPFYIIPFVLEEAVTFKATVNFDALVTVSAEATLGLNMNGVKFRRNQ